MQYVTETLDPRTGEPMTTEQSLQETESSRGAITGFVSKHPWLCIAAAFGAGLAVGIERRHIMSGARYLGGGCRTVGAGAWNRVGGAVSRIRS